MSWSKLKTSLSELSQRHNLVLIFCGLLPVLVWPYIFEWYANDKTSNLTRIVVWDAVFLTIWVLLYSALFYTLLPKQLNITDKELTKQRLSERKFWTSWYDLIWIFVAVLTLTGNVWRITENKLDKDIDTWTKIHNQNEESIVRIATTWIPLITETSKSYAGDQKLLLELTEIKNGKWVFLLGNSYVYGDKSNLYYLSDRGSQAFREIKSAVSGKNHLSAKITSLWDAKKKFGAPEGFDIFFPIIFSIALGLRLAKAIADVLDTRLTKKYE